MAPAEGQTSKSIAHNRGLLFVAGHRRKVSTGPELKISTVTELVDLLIVMA